MVDGEQRGGEMGWVHLSLFPTFLPQQMLCCAIYGFGRLSSSAGRTEFGSEKMTRRNKCDVQSGGQTEN